MNSLTKLILVFKSDFDHLGKHGGGSLPGKHPEYVRATGKDQDAILSNYHPKSQIHTRTTPETYFNKLHDFQQYSRRQINQMVDRPTVEKLKDRMRQHLPIDAVELEYDVDHNKYVNQEGRHRAVAAHELGIDMPAIVYLRNRDKYVNT